MKTRMLALFMVLTMLAALIGGCSSSAPAEASASESASPAETAAPTAAEPAGEQTSEAVPPESAPEASTVDGTYTELSDKIQTDILEGEISSRTDEAYAERYKMVEEVRANTAAMLPGMERTYNADGQEISMMGVPYTYPLEGERKTISIWAAITGNHQGVITDFSQYRDFAYATECTNIDVKFTSVSSETSSEQLNLMIASGDMTDLVIGFSMNYTGTLSGAYSDEIISDVTDYLTQYCPNYEAWRHSNESYMRMTNDDEGHTFGWYCLDTEIIPQRCWFIRQDKLEQWGIDAPVTLDDYVDCFQRMKDEGSAAAIETNSDTFRTILSGTWDIAALDGAALYCLDGKVVTSWDSPNAIEYVKTLHDWYEKGYIYNDVLSITPSPNDAKNASLTYGGDYFMFQNMASHYGDFFVQETPEGWNVVGGTDPVMNAGDKTHFDAPTDGMMVALTTSCEDIETASKYMDWFYTDEGINTANYGPEGVSWYWTPEGERVFTDAVWHEPDYGFNPSTAIGLYQLQGRFVTVNDPWYTLIFVDSTVPIEALKTWAADGDGTYYLPTNQLSLTTEETDTVYATLTDLQTYTEETISQMILGETDIDSQWDGMIEKIESLGLRDIIAQYQSAYDRYLAR